MWRMAVRPARDSWASPIIRKAREPVSQKDPGAAPLSMAILIYESSSGAYCTSSKKRGRSWSCKNRAGSSLASRRSSRSSRVT